MSRRRERCPCGKRCYPSAGAAFRAAAAVEHLHHVAQRAYRCQYGGWHVRTAVDRRKRLRRAWRERRGRRLSEERSD